MPDYGQLLLQYSPIELLSNPTNRYISAMCNETTAHLTKITLIEQYANPVADDIAFRDRQRLLDFMETLFILMHRHGYITVKNPAIAGRQLGYIFLGLSADNMYYYSPAALCSAS